jgi:hypothetical protein
MPTCSTITAGICARRNGYEARKSSTADVRFTPQSRHQMPVYDINSPTVSPRPRPRAARSTDRARMGTSRTPASGGAIATRRFGHRSGVGRPARHRQSSTAAFAASEDELLALLKPCSEEALKLWPVGKAAGNVKNTGPQLAMPI